MKWYEESLKTCNVTNWQLFQASTHKFWPICSTIVDYVGGIRYTHFPLLRWWEEIFILVRSHLFLLFNGNNFQLFITFIFFVLELLVYVYKYWMCLLAGITDSKCNILFCKKYFTSVLMRPVKSKNTCIYRKQLF